MLRQFAAQPFVRRSLRVVLVIGFLAPIAPSFIRAQQESGADRKEGEPAARRDRRDLVHPELLIAPRQGAGVGPRQAAAAVPNDPRIDAILVEWSQATKRIKKLQGSHIRMIQDFTNGVETWAQGRFYMETPDKGRIDVGPYTAEKITPGTKVKRVDAGNRFVILDLHSENTSVKWICDGNELRQIDVDRKTVEVLEIPPEQRGEKMIDGPLPFLFGMPPEKAKARYWFRLLTSSNPKVFRIRVQPKLQHDAAEWIWADLLLDKETYLPHEIRLCNPAETSITVYQFPEPPEVNKFSFASIFGANPFNPALYGYKREVHAAGGGGRAMPALVGKPYNETKPIIERLRGNGFQVKVVRGTPTSNPAKIHRVEEQLPKPGAPLSAGAEITLTLFQRDVQPAGVQQQAQKINGRLRGLGAGDDGTSAPSLQKTAKVPAE